MAFPASLPPESPLPPFLSSRVSWGFGMVWEGEREGEKQICLSHAPNRRGTWPDTQAHALTGNQTRDLPLWGMLPNPLRHTGSELFLSSFLGEGPRKEDRKIDKIEEVEKVE